MPTRDFNARFKLLSIFLLKWKSGSRGNHLNVVYGCPQALVIHDRYFDIINVAVLHDQGLFDVEIATDKKEDDPFF